MLPNVNPDLNHSNTYLNSVKFIKETFSFSCVYFNSSGGIKYTF